MFHFVHTDLLKWGSCQKRRIGPYIPSFPHPFLRRETDTTGDTLAIDLGSGEITAKNQLPGRLWACFRAGRECEPTFLRTSLAKGPLS